MDMDMDMDMMDGRDALEILERALESEERQAERGMDTDANASNI
jgi:hypothetical protein